MNVPVLDRLYEAYCFAAFPYRPSRRGRSGALSLPRRIDRAVPDAESFRDKVARAGSSGPRSRGYRAVSLPFIRAGSFRHESQIRGGLSPPPLLATQLPGVIRNGWTSLLKAHI